MAAYSILTFVIAVLLLTFGVLIHKGNTKWIHDYHQTRIKEPDKKDYGKAFAKGMFLIALTLIFSGMVVLFGEEKFIVVASVAILFIGLIISFMILSKNKRQNHTNDDADKIWDAQK